MTGMRSIIHGTAEDIQQAAVDLRSLLFAALDVEPFRVFTPEVGNGVNAKFPEVARNRFPDAGDFLKVFECGLFKLSHNFF